MIRGFLFDLDGVIVDTAVFIFKLGVDVRKNLVGTSLKLKTKNSKA